MSVPYDPEHITYFAETDSRNQRIKFGIKSRDRTRHMYVIGKSGVGKSTLLENMAIQDIAHGEGVAVLDPHGSFAEKMLEYIPEHRIKDVVYFAPFDIDNPISFNVLEDVGHDKRHLVASGLMSSFKKIWVDAWSARMEYILNNILLALLEYPGATLLGVNRMLADKGFRNKVVENITDPSVKAFWTDEFAKYGERYMQEAGAAIQNKIGQFTANPLVRNIIGQPKSTFDIRKVMDEQKILIINLSKGRIGEQNTSLLGSMIITKIYLAAMSRAELSSSRIGGLPNFYFYVDEFQSFANETFADILAEARKYKLALIIAHQYVAQMEEKVRDAVFGNVGTTISFRVGPLDAELLEKVFAPQFTQNDIINLGMAEIYLSLMINDIGSPPFSARTLPPLARPNITFRNDAIEWSRKQYSAPKEIVEKNIWEWFEALGPIEEDKPQKKIRFADDRSKPNYNNNQNYSNNNFKKDLPVQATNPPVERVEDINVIETFQTHQIQVKIPKTFTPKKEAQTHKPFAKAMNTVNSETQKAAFDIQKSEPSPKLKNLLDALDSENNMEEKSDFEKGPFNGEKPLKDSLQPVKILERGPTEKNRDLLKMALQNAMTKNEPKHNPIPDIKQKSDQKEKAQNPDVLPIISEDPVPEIDPKALQKILE